MMKSKHVKNKITAKTLHKHLCPLYLSLAGILSLNAEAAITPDSKQSNGATMGQAANGVPMVNIADPNKKGVSHNKFTQFDVDKQGMIFNNSKTDGVTQIGGYAVKNAQLQSEASAIISEVTGAKASYINGTMEVFGKKADVIIANENGISVNGASTLNANSLTLSTGRVQMKDDGTYKLAVEKGNISVTGKGISTDGLSYFDIVSRSATLQGEIAGSADLKILAGQNEYDPHTRTHTVRSKGDKNTPSVAIDGSALGSMYAGKIQLISTESGAGVRHAGSIIASNNIEISADGDISLTTLHSDNDISLAGKAIALNKDTAGNGGTEAQGNVIINALAGATINHDVTTHSGTIRIDASSLLQNAAALISESTLKTAVPAIQINVAGDYVLSGTLKALDDKGNVISGGVVTLKNGDFVVMNNGVEVPFASIISDAEIIADSGDVSITAKNMNNKGGVAIAKKGTLIFTLSDAFENSGQINATGDITLSSGSMKNNGTLYASGTQKLTVASLENNGRLFADKKLVMNASSLNNTGIIGVSAGEMQLTTAGDLINSGTLSGDDASLLLEVEGDVDNSGLIVSNKQDVTLNAKGKSVKNKGKIEGRNVSVDASAADAALVNTGSISAKQKLAAKAATLNNDGGQLSSAGDVALTAQKALINDHNGEILAEGSLQIQGDKASLRNENGGWIQASAFDIQGISTMDNTSEAVILSTGDLTLTGLDTLTNSGGTIQANNIKIDDINTLNNTAGGTLYTSESLALSNIDNLENDNALIMSEGLLTLAKLGTLTNSNGANLYGETGLSLSDITTLKNTGGAALQSASEVSLNKIGTLTNTDEAVITSAGDLHIQNATTVNNSAYMISEGAMDFSNGTTLKNEGVIQAGTDLIISNIKNLINQGSDHVLMALGNLTIKDIESLLNTGGAVITSGMNTVLEAIGVVTNADASVIQAQEGQVRISTDTLNNTGFGPSAGGGQAVSTIVANGDVIINADTVNNDHQAVIVSADSDLTLNVSKAINNGDGAVLVGNNKTTLNVSNGVINNSGSALIGGTDISLTSKSLNNTNSGSISAENSLKMALDHLDNTNGILESAYTLALDIVDSVYLENTNSDIRAGQAVDITTQGDFTNNTNVEAIGDFNVNAKGEFVNNVSIVTGGDLNVNAANITNNENTLLWTMGDMNLEARTGKFTNMMLGNVLSMGDISIIAKEIWNYAGIVRAEKDINLDAVTIKNESTYTGGEITQTQTQKANGTYKTIDNVTKKITVDTTIYIPVLASDIALDRLAEMSAGGNININQRDIYDTHDVNNIGGLIQAGKDITVTGNIYNSPTYTSESLFDFLTQPLSNKITVEFNWRVAKDHTTIWKFDTLYQYFNFLFGNGSAASKSGNNDADKERLYLSLVNAANSSTQLKSTMSKIFGETWQTQSFSKLCNTWSSTIGSNNAALKDNKIYFVPLEKGEITAGHNFTQNGGTINNGIAEAGVIKSNATVTDVDVGDYSGDTVIAGYDVKVNTKTIDELSMGISPLPTIKDMVSIPGMFELSDDFKKAAEAEKNGLEYDGPANHIVPIFETRPDMINQNDYSGADYWFDQIDDKETPSTPDGSAGNNDTSATYVVIGDNYFVSELIRREVTSSVGSFFAVRDGLEGDDLVQSLMDNAGVASGDEELGLVVGEPLTEEQKANLDQDIVWFVSQNINGVDVLVPVVYLCPETLKQIETGDVSSGTAAINAGNNMNVDADAINNANGSLHSGGDMTLVSDGDITNTSNGMNSGISAGGNMSMTSTDGNINNEGASIKADGDIEMTAENGDITMTASVGRDEDGSQKIHAFDDGVSAGGSISMKAKSITSNASDITAGEDITLKATDGDVTFNDLHEMDASRTIDTDIKGAGSYRTTDTKTTTAEAIGSNVSAGGKLTIDASNDVVMEGGSYTAETGDISAGNNVDIKTSEDLSETETTVTSREFVAGAHADAFGYGAEAEHSSLDGKSSSTSSGDYTSGGSEQEASSNGRRPGRAAIDDTAGFRLGMETITDTTNTQTKTNKNASLNFEKSASIEADNTVDIGGADLNTGGDLSISADTIASTKYEDEVKETTTHEDQFIGIKGEASSTVLDSMDKAGNLIAKAQDGQELNVAGTIAQAAGDVSNLVFNDLASGSVSIGMDMHKSSTSSSSKSENITHINSGGKISFNSKKDTTLNGVDMNAESVDINAGGDVNINAAQSSSEYSTSGSSQHAGLSMGGSVDRQGASAGVSFDYNGSNEQSSGKSKSFTNSEINANDVNINSGGDMTMTGGNITADTANLDIAGDLSISSVQDEVHTDASRQNWGGSVGIGINTKGEILPTIAGGGGGGSEHYDSATTSQQSGITTNKELNAKTGGDLNLDGSHLVSKDKTGDISVDGDINATEKKDYIDKDGIYGGAGAGIGGKSGKNVGKPTFNLYVDTVDEIQYGETQKSTIDAGNLSQKGKTNGNINTDSNAMSEVTEDRREAGNNISFTMAAPSGFGKKGSYDLDTPTPGNNKKPHTDTPSKKPDADTPATDNTKKPDAVTPAKDNTKKPDADTPAADDAKKPDAVTPAADDAKKPDADTPAEDDAKTPDAETPAADDAKKPDADTPAEDDAKKPDTDTPAEGETKKPDTDTHAGEGDDAKTPDTDTPAADDAKTPDADQPSDRTDGKKSDTTDDSSTIPADGGASKPQPAKKWAVPNTNYPTLSPGSATAKPSFDTPPTPKHKVWNGDQTNGVAPSSNTSGDTPSLSPGSSTGKTGMDMPPTPEHKTWDGDMSSTGTRSQSKQWLPLLQETPVDFYAQVQISFDDEQLS
ncbi:two-partner secretion domain-containing protein [unidentified bacterial endosymbiont]|uniref:two-partner secretion domain-containing protein n=1 Tax=unidentified bacterial endosymbiont TaxID=2355 RepID=UPI0020A10080|nr:hemagglutinin repeat-containing protein [unidentified bacterial endosymbiont]